MPPTSIGQKAEQAAAMHLQRNGFIILAHNWRTRWCEIDLVAQKLETVFLVEVKYRASAKWGNGLDYITPKKLQQMHFAARLWAQHHNWRGSCQLGAAEVSGRSFAVTNWIEIF